MDLSCENCPAKCCKYVALEIDKPTCKKDWDNIFWYLHHQNIVVFIDNDADWIIEFRTPCKHLQSDNRCGIYENRPLVCRKYTHKNCEFHNEETPYIEEFHSGEDLKQYLEKNNINYQFGEFKK